MHRRLPRDLPRRGPRRSSAPAPACCSYQQTAANLHAAPGDTIAIGRAGARAGRRDASTASSTCRRPTRCSRRSARRPARGLQAPPDNVAARCPRPPGSEVFDPIAAARPDLVRTQVHARLDHHLPGRPGRRLTATSPARASNLDVAPRRAPAMVGDNLGADPRRGARSDALYAQILFLFLGAPGAVLAGLLAFAVDRVSRTRRGAARAGAAAHARRDRPASCVALAAARGRASSACAGIARRAGRAPLVIGAGAFGTATLRRHAPSPPSLWAVGAALAGLAVAAVAVVAAHVARRARPSPSTGRAASVGRRDRAPWWMRWRPRRRRHSGCPRRVLAHAREAATSSCSRPRASRSISVSYWAFAGPALLWVGARPAHLPDRRPACWRRGRTAARRARCGRSPARCADGRRREPWRRQRRLVAAAAALVALTVAFAVSTADVQRDLPASRPRSTPLLTNGGDVTVTDVARASRSDRTRRRSRAIGHGAGRAQRRADPAPLRLRRLRPPGPLRRATRHDHQRGRRAPGRLLPGRQRRPDCSRTLAARPDAVLVSAETVHDYQLRPGDLLQPAPAGRPHQAVPRRCRSTTSAWPRSSRPHPATASSSPTPTYVAGRPAATPSGPFLVDTDGQRHRPRSPHALRASVGTDAHGHRHRRPVGRLVGSSLTAVDLAGLTQVELGFALVLAAAATGLALWLGLYERRRTFAIVDRARRQRPPARRLRVDRDGRRHRRRPGCRARSSPAGHLTTC